MSVEPAPCSALTWVVAGVLTLRDTDEVVARIETPTFTATGQQELADLLSGHAIERLVVSDYESMGMLEIGSPEIQIDHVWGATSQLGREALGPMLEHAVGDWLLVVRASAPMIYNLRPSAARLEAAAEARGLSVERVAALSGERAVLYRVRRGP